MTKHGPSVITFQLVTGRDHFFIVGAYIPPSDLNMLEDVAKAWQQCPKGRLPMFVEDLNNDLESPPGIERVVVIAK